MEEALARLIDWTDPRLDFKPLDVSGIKESDRCLILAFAAKQTWLQKTSACLTSIAYQFVRMRVSEAALQKDTFCNQVYGLVYDCLNSNDAFFLNCLSFYYKKEPITVDLNCYIESVMRNGCRTASTSNMCVCYAQPKEGSDDLQLLLSYTLHVDPRDFD